MDPISKFFSGIVSGVTQSAGSAAAKAVANNPTVQGAAQEIQDRLDKAESAIKIASFVGAAVVLFYFVPGFDVPIPRIFRKGRK